jgi:hypothetical protein
MKVRNPRYQVLLRCKASKHVKTEKAKRAKEKVALKKERFLEASTLTSYDRRASTLS